MSIVKYEKLEEAAKIKNWAERQNAQPALKNLEQGQSELTFNLAGRTNGDPLSWQEFEKRLKDENLALLVEPDQSSSNYFKFVENPGP